MLPKGYEKQSFLRFDCDIDVTTLVTEFESIDASIWESSYWGTVHCSIGMLLLRGGDRGDELDFFSEQVSDKAVLNQLPYMQYLISAEGPFGEAKYAFLFKMRANGVTLKHQDSMREWFDMYRIHVPIITNAGAHLVSETRSQHLSTGFAWTFNNQLDHGVVNGEQERIHLIFDAPYSEKMAAQIDKAELLVGEVNKAHQDRISQSQQAIASYPGDETVVGGIKMMQQQGANTEQIAQMLNAKKIPCKYYSSEQWNEDLVSRMLLTEG